MSCELYCMMVKCIKTIADNTQQSSFQVSTVISRQSNKNNLTQNSTSQHITPNKHFTRHTSLVVQIFAASNHFQAPTGLIRGACRVNGDNGATCQRPDLFVFCFQEFAAPWRSKSLSEEFVVPDISTSSSWSDVILG